MHALDVLGAAGTHPGARSAPLGEVGRRLERLRRFWSRHLDALGTELTRSRRRPLDETPPAAGRPDPNNEKEDGE